MPRRPNLPARTLTRSTITAVVLSAVLAASAVLAPEPARADRDRSAEAWLVAAIESERTSRGLPRLRTANDLADVAATWSARMAADGRLAHNPTYRNQICCWTVVTENVAMVPGIAARGGLDAALREAHRLFMGSSAHRANILSSEVNEVGVGVHVANDVVWVTQNFRHRPDAAPAPSPPSSSQDQSTRSDDAEAGSGSDDDASGAAFESPRAAFDPREVQGRLTELGWYTGAIDGVIGPLTLEAVSAFQSAAGLAVDGRIGSETLDALTADDAPHHCGAGEWADAEAALDALRRHALDVWTRHGGSHPAVGADHPLLVVLDHVAAGQAA